ncbi:hypothetical protein M758_9G108300 [Ceratodon purpureus]|nr:hypothetical protein M758_9G108300 [Ceratodon purpureus]
MRELGIYWRGSDRARRQQQECNQNQSFALPSPGCQARRRIANSVLVGCLIFLFFVTQWALLSRTFQTPFPIFTESLHHQGPARAVVFELYWYDRGSFISRNETFSALAGPAHRRSRNLLEHSEPTALTRQEKFDDEPEEEEQQFGEGFGDNLNLEFDSLKKRTGCNNDRNPRACAHGASSSAQGASSSTRAAVFGGHRKDDQEMESLHTKIILGNPGNGRMREYVVQVDTGSAHTWVHCVDSPTVGPGGLYKPRKDSYLNCETSRDICHIFQDGQNSGRPCNRKNKFRCLYRYIYGDKTAIQGSVIKADIRVDLNDGSEARHTIAIGCSIEEMEADTSDDDEDSDEGPALPSLKDGILGLGRHPAGLLSQLHSLGLFSEYVTALCLEHARPRHAIDPRGRNHPMEYTGFLSFGDLHTSQAARTVWTASIIPRAARPQDVEAIYTAKLVGITYRDSVISFRPKKRKKNESGENSVQVGWTQLGFDTGSDLTYLGSQLFKTVEDVDTAG